MTRVSISTACSFDMEESIGASGLPASHASRRVQHELARRLDVRCVLGNHEANRLALLERFPNVSRVRAYSIASSCARRANPTQLIATEMRLGVKKSAERDLQTLAFVAEPIRDRNRRAIEDVRCAVIGAAHAHRLVHREDRRARQRAVDEQGDGSVGAVRSRQPREEQPIIADRAEGDEMLFAAQIVGVALALDAAAQSAPVPAVGSVSVNAILISPLTDGRTNVSALLRRSRSDPSRATCR